MIWYLFGDRRLSGRARSALDEAATAGDEVGVSTISLAEIVYLEDKGRLPEGTFEELAASLEDSRTVLVAVPEEATLVEVRPRLADAVKLRRKEKRLKQAQLTTLLGSSQSRVAKVEAAAETSRLSFSLPRPAVARGWPGERWGGPGG